MSVSVTSARDRWKMNFVKLNQSTSQCKWSWELDSLLFFQVQTEAYKLEGIHKEKEEMCRKLQIQCEESEQESSRQLKQNQKSEELLEQYRCEIQEFKLKHRKQRMKFENQLHQLIEQHNNLHSVFTTERLPDEIKSAENMLSQLLSTEQMKLDQLHHLNEELQNVRQEKQQDTVTTETQEE